MDKKSLLLPLIFTLLSLAILCTLGLWQLQRLEWKTDLLAQLDAEYAKDAENISLNLDSLDDDFQFRRGSVEGTYDFDKQIFVSPRTYQNLPGRHVFTPLRLPDGTSILVNRGWVPNEWKATDETPDMRVKTQSGKVTGLLRSKIDHNPFMPDNVPERDQWYYVDIGQIAAAKNIPGLRPYVIMLEPKDGIESGYPVSAAIRPQLPNDHLQYAVFWFTMAGILVIIFALRFLRK